MIINREDDERVMKILAAARPKPAAEREAYLRSACAGDEDLLREVVDALSWEERMGGFLQQPVAMIADKSPRPGSAVTAAVQFSPGAEIGHYRIESKLGEGGMSTVWLAFDHKLGRRVAIKFLSDDFADAEARRRFQREAQMASSLNHPHIVSVYDIGEFEGRHYLVTEYVDGGTLKDWATEKPRTPKEVIELLTGVADGLAAAHQAGILHRDIKPLNILVARNGYAKLADFGLAKLAEDGTINLAAHSPEGSTRPGLILGTIAYMSPEQALGQPLDSRSDIFSFGVVLYEMLSGKRPFGGRTDLEVLKTIIHGDLPPLSEEIPEAYRNIVEKALEKDPAERYQSMREMVVDLRRGQRSQRSPAHPPLTPRPGDAAAGLGETIAAGGDHVPSSSDRGKQLPSTAAARAIRKPPYYGLALICAVILTVGVLALWKTVLQKPSAPRVLSFTPLTSDGQTKRYGIVTDGSRVYFTEWFADGHLSIMQVSVKGGEATAIPVPLKQPFVIDISKDGADMLIANFETQGLSFWIQPVAGGSPQRVGDIVAFDGRFGPDSSTVIFSRDHDIFTVNRDGSGMRKLLSLDTKPFSALGPPFAFRFSPDGRVLRFNQENYEAGALAIAEVKADGTGLHQLFNGWNGQWTHDGRFFIFQQFDPARSDLWVQREDSGLWNRASPKLIQLTSGPLDYKSPVIGPDDKQIFVIGASRRAEVVRFDSASGKFQLYLNGISAEGLTFSPDGQWVTYTTYPEGLLWRSRVDGSERLQLTFPPMSAYLPRWSPDGQMIAFNATMPGLAWNTYIISRDGGAPQRVVPSDLSQMDANWSPDGNSLAFAAQAGIPNRPISIVDLKTKRVSTLPGSTNMYSPHWSPDGRYMAAIIADRTFRLVLYDFATQKWTVISDQRASYEAWSRDGKFLYFLGFSEQFSDYRVFRLRLSDRKLETITDLKSLGRSGTGTWGEWFGLGPDDSPLVARDISTQEIYALEMDWP